MTINAYEQYFEADALIHGVERRGALVALISDSEGGHIRYEVAITFFPHREETDFAVSYDAFFSRVVYEAPGRRSKKRERQLWADIQALAAPLLEQADGRVLWERPLRPLRQG